MGPLPPLGVLQEETAGGEDYINPFQLPICLLGTHAEWGHMFGCAWGTCMYVSQLATERPHNYNLHKRSYVSPRRGSFSWELAWDEVCNYMYSWVYYHLTFLFIWRGVNWSLASSHSRRVGRSASSLLFSGSKYILKLEPVRVIIGSTKSFRTVTMGQDPSYTSAKGKGPN